jgi:hypothetical protein
MQVMLQSTTAETGFPTSYKEISGLVPVTAINDRGQAMPSIAISRIIAAALLAASTAASAAGGNKPPRVLAVPVLGLRLPLERLNLEVFPDGLRANCGQIEDEFRTSRVWIFGRARDAAKTYYVLTGYTKRLKPEPDQHRYEYWPDGVVFTVQGDKCGGDGAQETFDRPDPNADNDGNVPPRILKVLARDLASNTVKAFGGPDKLRAEIKSQRIDFNQLPEDLQEAFKPYFE